MNLVLNSYGVRGIHSFMECNDCSLSYDIASESEITPCIKNYKLLVLYRFYGKRYEMTLLMSNIWQNPNVFTPKYDFKIILNVI